MSTDSDGICMGVDQRNHQFAPGLPLGWIAMYLISLDVRDDLGPPNNLIHTWIIQIILVIVKIGVLKFVGRKRINCCIL